MAAKVNLSLHTKQMEVYQSQARYRVVVAGRRWGKCNQKGTQITMADGTLKSVENIEAGDCVLTINEDTYKLESKKVQHLHDNGVKETVTVVTRSGKRLTVTPNHPLLANNRWTEAKDIVVGDLVAIPRATVFGDKTLPDHVIDFLAIWLADGDRNGYTKSAPQIIALMNDAAARLGAEFVDEASGDRREGLYWRWRRAPGSSRNGCIELLRSYGLVGTTSKTKFIPDDIFRLSRVDLARFLNRFVACDGSVNRRAGSTWAMEIGLANEKMVRQLAELFLKFGIRGQISHKVHKAKSSVTGENFESWRFIVSESKSLVTYCREIGAVGKGDRVASALKAAESSSGSRNTYLPIRHDEFVKHLRYVPKATGKYGGYNCAIARDLPEELRQGLTSWRKQTPSRISEGRYASIAKYSDGYFDPMLDGDFAWDEVLEIISGGERQTYDLTVEGNHNFIADGIVTHNTALSRVLIIKKAQKRKQKIWYVAPTYKMAKQIMWIDLMDAIPRKWIRKVNETSLTITLINGTRIELKGADKADSLRGVGIHFLVLDEFQDMSEEVWTLVLRPTLADTGGHAIFIGCVNEHTRILKRDGVTEIGSLSRGSSDKVLDPTDLDLYGLDRKFHNADGFWNNGVVDTKKIKTHMGFEIEASLPHPVWTIDAGGIEGWKKTSDIQVGDRIAIARGMEVWGEKSPLDGWKQHAENWRKQFVGKRGPKPERLTLE
jgi:intein/homing endonuclease